MKTQKRQLNSLISLTLIFPTAAGLNLLQPFHIHKYCSSNSKQQQQLFSQQTTRPLKAETNSSNSYHMTDNTTSRDSTCRSRTQYNTRENKRCSVEFYLQLTICEMISSLLNVQNAQQWDEVLYETLMSSFGFSHYFYNMDDKKDSLHVLLQPVVKLSSWCTCNILLQLLSPLYFKLMPPLPFVMWI